MNCFYSITLQGYQPGNHTTLNFLLGDFDPPVFADLEAAAAAIRTQLLAISEATVKKESIRVETAGASALPPAGTDATDELVIMTLLNAVGEPEKLHALRVPAPNMAVFNSDGVTLDTADAGVIAYVSAVADNALVSDGESIVTANDNGIKSGHWRSRAKRLG